MGARRTVAPLAFLREAMLFSHRTLRVMLQRLLNCLTAPRAVPSGAAVRRTLIHRFFLKRSAALMRAAGRVLYWWAILSAAALAAASAPPQALTDALMLLRNGKPN